MTWVPLDDNFPNHPKASRAGDNAAWLYVCGLCYAGQNLTDGLIPKNQVPKLTGLSSPARLARKLVDVGLWEEAGEFYRIHDYHKWNKPAEDVKRKRESDRERKAKWRQSGGRDADSPADATRDGPGQRPMDGTTESLGAPTHTPSSEVNSSHNPRLVDAGRREEGSNGKPKSTAVCEAAYAWLARLDYERTSRSGSITSPEGWIVRATQNRRSRHRLDAERLIAEHPDWTPEQLAKAVAGRDSNGAPGEATVAAAWELAQRNEAERCLVHGRLEPDDPVPDCSRCRAVVGARS